MFKAIEQNFNFIVIETSTLIDTILEFLKTPDKFKHEHLVLKDDYIDNLRNTIENQCYEIILHDSTIQKSDVNKIRAIQIIAVNLERIADKCVNIIAHADYLQDRKILEIFDFNEGLSILRESIELIIPGFNERDLTKALQICRAEPELDEIYRKNYENIIVRLQKGKNVRELIDILFMFRYLERMGDTVLNIGEALMLEIIGHKIKIQQFKALEKTLSQSGYTGELSGINYESILGTRSGNRIGRVERGFLMEDEAQESIFKEGNIKKILSEKESLETWGKIIPGLTPRVISYNENVDYASILEEYLYGVNLEQIIISADNKTLNKAVEALKRTLRGVWSRTRKEQKTNTRFISQLKDRLATVRRIHPDFAREEQSLGSVKVIASSELIDRCAELESSLTVDFTVRIHGDFNLNNVIYNNDTDTVHYVDVYRSKDADYIQDISVFLISLFRMPIFDEGKRTKLNSLDLEFYNFSKSIAEEWNDSLFDVRLALALARSFYTSTRFELDNEFAREMFFRAHFLMEKVVKFSESGNKLENFHLQTSVLQY